MVVVVCACGMGKGEEVWGKGWGTGGWYGGRRSTLVHKAERTTLIGIRLRPNSFHILHL